MGFYDVTFSTGKKSDVKFENFEVLFKFCIGIRGIFSSLKFRVFGLVLVSAGA